MQTKILQFMQTHCQSKATINFVWGCVRYGTEINYGMQQWDIYEEKCSSRKKKILLLIFIQLC